MNEIEKAIEVAKIKQICEFCVDMSDVNCFKCKKVNPVTVEDLRQYYNHIIQALKEKQERENPQPLTLDELREMGGEPYWHNSLTGRGDEWNILYPQIANAAKDYKYGQNWLAYRYRPDGEDPGATKGE